MVGEEKAMLLIDWSLIIRPCKLCKPGGSSGDPFLWVQVPAGAACVATWLGLKALYSPGILLAKSTIGFPK